jgi:hypothetical protein
MQHCLLNSSEAAFICFARIFFASDPFPLAQLALTFLYTTLTLSPKTTVALTRISNVMGISARNPDLDYVRPDAQVYTGLWCLQAGATLFLTARLWTKLTRRHGVWWDDYILIATWVCERSATCLRAMHCILIIRAASSYDQRHHNHHRIRDRLRESRLGFSNAHPYRHHLLPHSAGSESFKDSVCSNIAEVNERRPVAARDFMVLHRNDERIQSGKGTNIFKTSCLALDMC